MSLYERWESLDLLMEDAKIALEVIVPATLGEVEDSGLSPDMLAALEDLEDTLRAIEFEVQAALKRKNRKVVG